MKNFRRTLSALLALLLVSLFVPWGGMVVKAEEYYARGYAFLQPTSVTKPATLSADSKWAGGHPEIIVSLDNQMGDPSDPSNDGNKGTVLNTGLYVYEPATAEGWAEVTGVSLKSQVVSDPQDGDDIVRVSNAGCEASQVRIVPIRDGTATVILNVATNVTDGGETHEVWSTVSLDVTVKKVIDQVKLQPWFIPEDGPASGYQATVANSGPMIRREGLDNGATKEPSVGTKTLHWSDDDDSNSIITLAAAGDFNHNVTITPKNAGLANIYSVPHVSKTGVTRSAPYSYTAGDNSGTTHVVVAKVKPQDQIIYVTQEADLIVDTANTYPNTTDTLPTDSDYPNTAHRVTHEWSLVNPASSDSTGKTGTYINMTDNTKTKVKGVKVGHEDVKAITPPPEGYYAPDSRGREAVNGTGTIYVVQPEFLIPPRVVNKDGEDARRIHNLPTEEFTGNTGTKAKYLPATKPTGAESLDLPAEIPAALKHIAYSAPSSDNDVAKSADSGITKIEGLKVGTTDITASFTPATTIQGSDTAKALVVRDYVDDQALAVGEKGWLGPQNFSGITVSGETYTVTFGTPSDTSKINVSPAGQVTALAPTGSTPVSVPVTISRKVNVNGTEYTLVDTNECLVEVKNSPLDIEAGFIRYTGRKLNNAKDIPSSLTYTYTSNGSPVTGVDLSSQLNSARWTPTEGKATVSGKSLTPELTYDATGNEQLTTPASSISSDDYTVRSAVINVDIYGYEFTGKKDKTYTKQSKKDVDYTISLYDDFTAEVALPSSFVADGEILSELDRVEILDKNENPLKTEIKLTKGGAKDGTDYNYKKGSVVLTLEDTFLDTLDYGTYKLIGYFNPSTESGQVDTLNVATLKIEKPIVPGTDISTADATRVGGVTVLFGTSLAILLWLRKKRKEQEAAAAASGEYRPARRGRPDAMNFLTGPEESDLDNETDEGNSQRQRFRKHDPFDADISDDSQEYADNRSREADSDDRRGQIKHLPPKHVALDDDAREFDRRARRYSPDQRERMMEDRRRYYERRSDGRGNYRYSSREARYRDEMGGYYPRRRGNDRRGGRRPY